MGCISSKTDINDLHPNVFHVMNVNEEGHCLSSGQLEITEADIIFYQKGKVPMKWPLKCLRRYGFDAELFSFESGRRCPTGPGIYAFNCRRAEQLFNMLQCHIQHCHNGASGEDAVSREFPAVGMSSVPTVPSSGLLMSTSISRTGFPGNGVVSGVNDNHGAGMDNGNYLEPVRSASRGPPTAPRVMPMQVGNGVSTVARLSVSSGPLSPQSTTSPPPNVNLCLGAAMGSSSSANDNSSSYYANEELFSDPEGRVSALEEGNRQVFPAYTNGSAVTTPSEGGKSGQRLDLADVSADQMSVSGGGTKSTPGSLGSVPLLPLPYMNLGLGSPHAIFDAETNYTKLDDLIKSEQEAQLHLYMNVVPENSKDSTAKVIAHNDQHCYENLEPGEINGEINSMITLSPVDGVVGLPSSRVGVTTIGSNPASQVPIHLSLTPVAQTTEVAPIREVNYVVLDLDRGSDSNNSQTLPTSPIGSVASFPESPRRVSESYATIDFNKTVALSHSVNPNMDNDTEGSRKTRHNSTINDLSLTRNSSSLSD